LYSEASKFDSAIECYETSREIFRRLQLPDNHSDIASIECHMGDVDRRKKDWDSALKHYEHSLQMFTETLPDSHPSIAYCHSFIGLLELRRNHIELARKHFEQALQKYKQNSLPDNHPNIQYSLHNLKCSTYEEAIDCYITV
jgi:tetratricopeptide (TPR) repeat protein